jgi:hypothetical protein
VTAARDWDCQKARAWWRESINQAVLPNCPAGDRCLRDASRLGQGLGSSRTRGLEGGTLFLNPHVTWYRKSNPVRTPEELIVAFRLNKQVGGTSPETIQLMQRTIVNFFTAKRLA